MKLTKTDYKNSIDSLKHAKTAKEILFILEQIGQLNNCPITSSESIEMT